MQQEKELTLSFQTTRDSKNIKSFVKILLSMYEFLNSEDKIIYIYLSKNDVRLISNISNIYGKSIDNGTFVCQLKKQMYQLQGTLESPIIYQLGKPLVYLLNNKMCDKLTILKLIFNEAGLILKYSTNDNTQFYMQMPISRYQGQWPIILSSNLRQYKNQKLVHLFSLSNESCKKLRLDDRLWLEIKDRGIIIKKMRNNQFVLESHFNLEQLLNYDYMNIRTQLQSQTNVDIGFNKVIKKHIELCISKKYKCKFSMVLTMDLVNEMTINQTHLLLETKMDKCHLYKIIPVFITNQLKPIHAITEVKEQFVQYRPITKKQNNIQQIRRAVLNRYVGYQYELQMAKKVQEERQNYGKQQPPEQTLTKKWKLEA